MKNTFLITTLAVAALAVAGCSKSTTDNAAQKVTDAANATVNAASDAAATAKDAASNAADSAKDAANTAAGAVKDAVAQHTDNMNWYGGPVYTGDPALTATAALVAAGGGAENFDFSKALVAMLGADTVNKEVAKLTQQYGQKNVEGFVAGMTYAVKTGLKLATDAGVKLPEAPADLTGTKLASALVDAGTAEDGTFWAGLMFDHAISHDLHVKVMQDINKNISPEADENTHRILNQAMYDVAQALGKTNVKLASLH
ncbi:MAG: hypothetical protein EPN72_03865 [Nevskiaceae bacterium]|nr:MAG: hypothetical protein EPN63_06645 [Nevskiaceae bacterium]TBR73959.1 MAG: hypothetical protein EPN72_03865 [Nevskiaceae bacterium]